MGDENGEVDGREQAARCRQRDARSEMGWHAQDMDMEMDMDMDMDMDMNMDMDMDT